MMNLTQIRRPHTSLALVAQAADRFGLFALDGESAGKTDFRAVVAKGALSLLPVCVGLIAIVIYDRPIVRLTLLSPELMPVFVLALCGLCILLAPFRYPESARPARFLLVGLAIAVGLYGMGLGTVLGMETLVEGVDRGLLLGYYALLPMTALAIFRPSFALYPFVYVATHKELTRALTGARELGNSDYLPLIEVGLFLAVGVITISMMAALLRWKLPRPVAITSFEHRSAVLVLVVAIGAHFGNYFMSGMTKIMLDGGPFSWALENPTSSLMLAGYNLGTAPLSLWPDAFVALYTAFSAIEMPVNVVTLLAQLLCFAAFFRQKLMIAFAAFFDLMHVTIYLLTGALFVPWIILNSLIVAALVRNGTRLNTVAVCVGVISTIFAHTIFWNAKLGWYDSRQIRHAYFVAETEDAQQARVPSNFIRESSYLLMAKHFGFRHTLPSGHMPTGAWGQIGGFGGTGAAPSESDLSSYQIMQLGRDCAYPVDAPFTPPDYDTSRPEPFIRAQHSRALRLAERDWQPGYNMYVHHHFSLPGRFPDFESLELSRIVAYRYVVETVCMGVEDGVVRSKVMTRTVGPRIEVGG